MKKTEFTLVSFSNRDLTEILKQLKIKEENGNLLDNKGNSVTCEICNTPLTKSNIGLVTKGSTICICDNPACIATFILKRNEQRVKENGHLEKD